jgi:hypothetical protein
MYNFSKNLQSKSHPLEISSDEDESDGNDDRSSPIFLLNINKSSSSKNDFISSSKPPSFQSNDFIITNNNIKSNIFNSIEEPPTPPKREKRLAPKLPENKPVVKNNSFFVITDNVDKNKNFYIYIDHVKWYYKGDKKSKGSKNQTAQSTTSSATILTKQTDSFSGSNEINISTSGYSASNDVNDLNNNIFNTNRPNIHNISSKKWFEFNKYDSYNLELEYRDMMTKKNCNVSIPSKPVQVLENLYEVNLETKKCYSIYWKSIFIELLILY